MVNSKRASKAAIDAFEELLALSPDEVHRLLNERELGSVGSFMKLVDDTHEKYCTPDTFENNDYIRLGSLDLDSLTYVTQCDCLQEKTNYTSYEIMCDECMIAA